MKRVAITCTLLASILILSGSLLHAQTIVNISHAGGSPYATIQEAVDNAATLNGDTITISAGTILELPVPSVTKTLTFVGSGNPTITSLILSAASIKLVGITLPEVTVNPPAAIQDGIDAIVPISGTVNVNAGTYNEHVVINKPMNLIGSGTSTVTINGGGTGSCITVGSGYVRVKQVVLTNAVNGLSGTATNGQFRFITITGNTGSGISFSNSDFNLIHSNYISGHVGGSSAGIELIGCRNNTITGNNVHDNTTNIKISGSVFRSSSSNIVQGNTLLNPSAWSLDVSSGAGTTKANLNVFSTTIGGDKFIRNTTTPTATLEARHNYFQGHDHPGNPGFPTDFFGAVDSLGWFDNSSNTNVAIYPFGFNMVADQAMYFSVMAMVPPSRQVRASKVTLTWDSTLTYMEDGEIPGAFFLNKLGVGQNETSAFTPAEPANSITVFDTLNGTAGGVGGSGGIPYVGTLFIMKFHTRTDGVDTLKLTSVDLRDENMDPLAQTVNLSPGSINIGGSPTPELIVDTKVFLQGAYNGTGLDTTLRHSVLLPLTQPYNVSPFNYAGTETVDPSQGIPEGAVDWIYVELRTGTAANTAFARRAGWLLTDGSIRDLAGHSPIGFPGIDDGNYYVVLRHRNHLGIMSAAALPLSATSDNYDFTIGQGQAFGTNPMIQVGSAFCMIGGDANGSGDITILDRATWRIENSQIGYLSSDFNLSGDVTILDRAIWRVNNSLVSQVP